MQKRGQLRSHYSFEERESFSHTSKFVNERGNFVEHATSRGRVRCF